MSAQFKDRLHHDVPAWVRPGSTYHIRIRCERASLTRAPLIGPSLAEALLDSARFYHLRRRWCCFLFQLMPDHLHALIAFPEQEAMSAVLHDWKSWHTRNYGVEWQDGFFDHRIRNDHEFELKADYIRQNPVVKNLGACAKDWRWFCEPLREEMDGQVSLPVFHMPTKLQNAGAGTRPPTS